MMSKPMRGPRSSPPGRLERLPHGSVQLVWGGQASRRRSSLRLPISSRRRRVGDWNWIGRCGFTGLRVRSERRIEFAGVDEHPVTALVTGELPVVDGLHDRRSGRRVLLGGLRDGDQHVSLLGSQFWSTGGGLCVVGGLVVGVDAGAVPCPLVGAGVGVAPLSGCGCGVGCGELVGGGVYDGPGLEVEGWLARGLLGFVGAGVGVLVGFGRACGLVARGRIGFRGMGGRSDSMVEAFGTSVAFDGAGCAGARPFGPSLGRTSMRTSVVARMTALQKAMRRSVRRWSCGSRSWKRGLRGRWVWRVMLRVPSGRGCGACGLRTRGAGRG